MGRSNHVGKNHCFDAFKVSRECHARRHLAAAIGVIRISPLDAILVGPLALRLFAVEKYNPHIESALYLAATEKPCQLKHRASARTSIVGANEVRHAQGVIVRGVEDDVAICTGNLSNYVFHCNITEWRRAMEILLFDLAPKPLELADDISLRATNSIRGWRSRSDFDQLAHVFVSLGAVEAASSRRWKGRWRIRHAIYRQVVRSCAVYARGMATARERAPE